MLSHSMGTGVYTALFVVGGYRCVQDNPDKNDVCLICLLPVHACR